MSDCLRARPMSVRRENRIRDGLGLAPLCPARVVYLDEGQRVVTETPKRDKVRRGAWLTPKRAALADRLAHDAGYRSFGAWSVAELLPEDV